MAFEINLGSCLDKQADNDISDIDQVGTKPNPGFSICTCLGFSTVSGMLVIVGDSGINFLCFM